MRKVLAVVALLAVFGLASSVAAQEGETWESQEKVYFVTLIKVHPNMDEKYLNNLKRTWVVGVKEAMKEGLTLDYKILTSFGYDEGYNLLLLTEHPNLAAFDATPAWREKVARITKQAEAAVSRDEADKITTTVYPEIRTFLSTKLLREIKFIE